MIIPAFLSGVMFAAGIVRYLLQQYEYAIVDIVCAVLFIMIAFKAKSVHDVDKEIEVLKKVIKKIDEAKHETGKQ